MKKQRHKKITELIKRQPVETQEELLNLLKTEGFDVTQATVSRDIRDLRLTKILNDKGKSVYTFQQISGTISERYREIFKNSVLNVDYALNNVVIKCHEGTAGAACAALDSLKLENIIGTLAGDDTIFVVTRNEESSLKLLKELENF